MFELEEDDDREEEMIAVVSRHTGCVERGVDIVQGGCSRTGEYGVDVAGRGRR